MALFFESLCARAQRALACNKYNASTDNDLTYILSCGNGEESAKLKGDVPLGTTALSLLALYDLMGEGDYLVSAWWHRLSSACGGSQRLRSLVRNQLLRFPLDRWVF